MPEAARFVADTNVLVSRLLFRQSDPALALRKAMSDYRLIVSSEILIELGTVLSRPKFDRYLSVADRLEFFHRLRRLAIHIHNVPPVTACRDPKDDKFLALALAGRATLILTGDDDLLTLHPFRNIPILSPRQFLDLANDPPTR
jgi:putative PIN family toxin of toxin-antitoxin system